MPSMWDIMAPYPQPACKVDESGNIAGHWNFARSMKRTVWNSALKGLYREKKDKMVSDECMGDWMVEAKDKVLALVHKVENLDFFGISHTEANDVALSLLDTVYKNVEVCHWQLPLEDGLTWCTQNVEQCIWSKGAWDRFTLNAIPMLRRAADLVEIYFMTDDECYNDTEILEEMARSTEDTFALVALFTGFDTKWNPEKVLSGQTVAQQLSDLVDAAAVTVPEFDFYSYTPMGQMKHHGNKGKGQCPFKAMFEGIESLPTNLAADLYPKFNKWGDLMTPKLPVQFMMSPTQEWRMPEMPPMPPMPSVSSWDHFVPVVPPMPSMRAFDPLHLF